MAITPTHDRIETARFDTVQLTPWSRLGEHAIAILFTAAAMAAMGGWLYVLGGGLWAAASWLIF